MRRLLERRRIRRARARIAEVPGIRQVRAGRAGAVEGHREGRRAAGRCCREARHRRIPDRDVGGPGPRVRPIRIRDGQSDRERPGGCVLMDRVGLRRLRRGRAVTERPRIREGAPLRRGAVERDRLADRAGRRTARELRDGWHRPGAGCHDELWRSGSDLSGREDRRVRAGTLDREPDLSVARHGRGRQGDVDIGIRRGCGRGRERRPGDGRGVGVGESGLGPGRARDGIHAQAVRARVGDVQPQLDRRGRAGEARNGEPHVAPVGRVRRRSAPFPDLHRGLAAVVARWAARVHVRVRDRREREVGRRHRRSGEEAGDEHERHEPDMARASARRRIRHGRAMDQGVTVNGATASDA